MLAYHFGFVKKQKVRAPFPSPVRAGLAETSQDEAGGCILVGNCQMEITAAKASGAEPVDKSIID